MDAPKGRYSVVERDGRLVVIDNGTGAPIPSTVAPRAGSPGRPGAAQAVSGGGPGLLDRLANLLLALAVREFDSQGRAVIAWSWQQNGRDRRWDALLDERQQRRMARALLAFAPAPLLPLALVLADVGTFALATLFVFPLAAWGALSLQRLQRETDDPSRRP